MDLQGWPKFRLTANCNALVEKWLLVSPVLKSRIKGSIIFFHGHERPFVPVRNWCYESGQKVVQPLILVGNTNRD